MAKRTKRAKKGAISIKEEIEKHFKKLENDISENNLERGRYHFKELNFDFLPALEKRLKILGESDDELISFKKRLDDLKEKLGIGY